MAGGMSWTENWLQFDNSYFRRPYKSKSKEQRKRDKEGSEECKDAIGVVMDRTESLSSAGTACPSDSPSRRGVRGGQEAEESSSSSSSLRTPTAPIVAGRHRQGHRQGQGHASNEMDTSCSSSNSNSHCSASSPSPSPSPSTHKSLCPFSSLSSSELLWLPTDEALFKAPEFKFYFEQYAKDQNLFFADYSKAHRKMSELGAKFDPPEGIEFS